jgi:hypothetical protein
LAPDPLTLTSLPCVTVSVALSLLARTDKVIE